MKLAGERFVVTHDEGGDVQPLNDVRHGKRLAATGDAQQDASLLPIFQLRNQFFNCFWLVAGGLEFSVQAKPLDGRVEFVHRRAVERF